MKTRNTARENKMLLSHFSDTPSDLIFWSFRYFLGRRTIATCAFAENLAKGWPHLEERVRTLIKRELEEAFRSDDECRATNSNYRSLGDDCDRRAWEKVREAYKK